MSDAESEAPRNKGGRPKGYPKTGGRQKGVPVGIAKMRKQAELMQDIELSMTPKEAATLQPLHVMLRIMRARVVNGDEAGALAAAYLAAPYAHAKLAQTDLRVTSTWAEKTTADLMAEREELANKMVAAEQLEGTAVELNTEQPAPTPVISDED